MKKILNIILGILLAVMAVLGIYAIATGGSEAAISLNLIWCYFLLALAVFTAIFCAVFGMIQNPSGNQGHDYFARADHRDRGRGLLRGFGT